MAFLKRSDVIPSDIANVSLVSSHNLRIEGCETFMKVELGVGGGGGR